MNPIDWQQLNPSNNSVPVTLVAAATIAPTTFLTNISGTTAIATITPPVITPHMLALNFTNAAPGGLLTTGNILIGTTTATTNKPVLVVYNPVTAKYMPVGT